MTATRTKRILSVQNVSDGGGSEKALVRMIRRLAAEGWDCHVAIGAPPRLAAEYAAAGATLHVVPMQRLTTSGSRSRWLRYVLAWPGSVVHLILLGRRLDVGVIHTNTLHSWYGWGAAWALRRPHVWQAREIVVQSSLALRVERLLTRRFADLLIATSAAVAAQFDHPQLAVVFDEADPAEFTAALAGRFRSSVGIADDAALVASVGRIDTWKGVDVLLDAIPLLRKVRPDAVVIIAGSPVEGKEHYADELASRSRTLGVRWLGHRDDVAELMADIDLYVMASTHPEPFGLGMVEALASGVPVVASDAGGPVEVLGGLAPTAARRVPPGDPLALANAIADLLPPGGSTTAQRRSRTALRVATAPPFGAIFDDVVADPRRRWVRNPRRGHRRDRPSPPPPSPS